jgi:poly-gamma-glutamate capsule biosynthesis protein CapA/YwtB (metallophosphatase superfamily)
MRLKIVLIQVALTLIFVTDGIPNDEELLEPIPIISVAAVGDIMMGTTYPFPNLPEEEGRLLLEDSKEILKTADIAFGNLEGPLCDGGSPRKNIIQKGLYIFRTPTRFVKNLSDSGFNVMSLANNHMEDFGSEGVSSTKKALDREGIKYSSKAGEIAEFDIKGVKVGLMAVSSGPPPRSIVSPNEILLEIEMLSKKYDLLIVSVHGGKEGTIALHIKNEEEYYLGEPRGNLVEFAHRAIENGADLILGHGPHVPRALEIYQKRLIAYSLGNFCTYGRMSLEKENGFAPMLWVEISGRGDFLKGKLYSFIQVPPGGPKKDENERAWTLIKMLSQQDFPETSPFFDLSEITPR